MHVPAKPLTVAVCAIRLAIGAWLLWPVAASAQINIPGIVFGGMNYHYGNGAYRGHRRVHETKHERRHKGDSEDADQGAGTNGKPDPVPDNKSVAAAPDKKPAPAPAPVENKPAETASAGAPPSGGAPASTGAPAAAGAPAATNNDQPTFSPSR
jgi:hypothetical protein